MIRVRECEVVYRARQCDAPTRRLASSSDVYLLMCGLGAPVRATESFWAVLVDARQQMLAVHEVARGSISSVSVACADVFRAAIVAGAVGVILVHNHPSGDPEPSAEDFAFTDRVRRAGQLLGISVLDHIIVGGNAYSSLLDMGRWPALTEEA